MYAKVVTDRWCRNDFQKAGQAAGQEVAVQGSAQCGRAAASGSLLSRPSKGGSSPFKMGGGGVNYA